MAYKILAPAPRVAIISTCIARYVSRVGIIFVLLAISWLRYKPSLPLLDLSCLPHPTPFSVQLVCGQC